MWADAQNRRLLALAAAMFVAIIGIQMIAGAVAPAAAPRGSGQAVGRAGFAYLGGLRTFAAATLWNRIEPQFHSYYSSKMPLAEMDFMLPTMNMVVLLDPQFEQAYYISSFIVFQGDSPAEGVAIAAQGVKNNPESGLLNANYASLLYRQDKVGNKTKALEAVQNALLPSAKWASPNDQFEGYGMIVSILRNYGLDPAADQAFQVQQSIEGVAVENHDHDGDGHDDHDPREHQD